MELVPLKRRGQALIDWLAQGQAEHLDDSFFGLEEVKVPTTHALSTLKTQL